MPLRILLIVMLFSTAAFSQMPKLEPGVSQELAKWRAAHYSDVRYKLNLTLEKMSPVLKGTIEIRVNVSPLPKGTSFGNVFRKDAGPSMTPIVLDWRKIKGFEERSTVSNVTINGKPAVLSSSFSWPLAGNEASRGSIGPPKGGTQSFGEINEHLVFSNGVVMGENVIKLDFTSPILPSGSAITRYVDKEDGAEYLYSLFVPSDASTAFPVFDQPDLKARFSLEVRYPNEWTAVANSRAETGAMAFCEFSMPCFDTVWFSETKPISTYVFAFAAGPFEKFDHAGGNPSSSEGAPLQRDASGRQGTLPTGRVSASRAEPPALAGGGAPAGRPAPLTVEISPPAYAGGSAVYVRKSQAAKFRPHAAEVFRLNREAVKYFEEYFDYRFPWPKYDLVLIPEFPFGGMEHAGATFLREASVIFPQEPTRNDHINRATLIFHEVAHQWFGDTVTMRWFDDLWLKEGFATFSAYKALEKIMPEVNAWKVFYERVKQGAYQTDSTRGTTPIYQEIPNLSAAKSAYGNIVYNKAPAFLRQAEFYLGADKFRAAVRSFLKKHEFGNAGWEDLVAEFQNVGWRRDKLGNHNSNAEDRRKYEEVSKSTIGHHLNLWIKNRGVPLIRMGESGRVPGIAFFQQDRIEEKKYADLWTHYFNVLFQFPDGSSFVRRQFLDFEGEEFEFSELPNKKKPTFVFPNYGDYGYGIFLLDEKSREYVLKNIQNEKDPFLRSMMWGALWDSVREGELDPREYVGLVVKVLSSNFSWPPAGNETPRGNTQPAKTGTQNAEDESTTALLLARVGTALNYYIGPSVSSPHVSKGSSRPTGPLNRAEKQALKNDGDALDRRSRALTDVRATDTDGLARRVEDMLIAGMRRAETQGLRITYYRAFLNVAGSEKARRVLKEMLNAKAEPLASAGGKDAADRRSGSPSNSSAKAVPPANAGGSAIPLKTKDKFDIVTRLLVLGDPEAPALLAALEKAETSDEAKRYAYAARAGIATVENKAKYWKDFTENMEIRESWIEAAFGPWNSIRHSELTMPYLERSLKELPNHKRNRKIFFVNGWLGAFIGGQRSAEALAIVNQFLADNPNLDRDLRLKILENVDIIERAVKIRKKYGR